MVADRLCESRRVGAVLCGVEPDRRVVAVVGPHERTFVPAVGDAAGRRAPGGIRHRVVKLGPAGLGVLAPMLDEHAALRVVCVLFAEGSCLVNQTNDAARFVMQIMIDKTAGRSDIRSSRADVVEHRHYFRIAHRVAVDKLADTLRPVVAIDESRAIAGVLQD